MKADTTDAVVGCDYGLATMDANVVWPNGMESGYVYGHGGVREYWLRQWSVIDAHVEPVALLSTSIR